MTFYLRAFSRGVDTKSVSAVVLVALFLLAPVYALSDAGEAALLTAGAVVAFLLGVYIGGSDDDGDDTDSWNPIPSRQYGGRYAELGGLTRDEQEKAMREVQEKADDVDAER
jgi:hypothetical protein